MSSDLRLPLELYQRIASHLEDEYQASLYLSSLCLVSQGFRHAAHASLYHSVYLPNIKVLTAFLSTCATTQHGQLVRSLDIALVRHDDRGSLDSVIAPQALERLPWLCPRLQNLSIFSFPAHWRFHDENVLQTWLHDENPWYANLRELDFQYFYPGHLPWCIQLMHPFQSSRSDQDAVDTVGPSSVTSSQRAPRAMTTIKLNDTGVPDELVFYILTNPSYAGLRTLDLANCSLLRDVGILLRKAFTGQPPDPGELTEREARMLPFVQMKLESVDLSGTYLMDVGGIGDFWEDINDDFGDDASDEFLF
ncbi:hypothetical protein ACQY0O_006271 [Thecaphora frezii]